MQLLAALLFGQESVLPLTITVTLATRPSIVRVQEARLELVHALLGVRRKGALFVEPSEDL
jgi:hypothetical protein